MHPYVTLFGTDVPAYWLAALAGAALCALYATVANRRGTRGQLPGDDLLHIGLMALIGALIGGVALYFFSILPLVVSNWAALRQNGVPLAQLLFGGSVFYGGLLGGLAAAWLYCRRYAVSFRLAAAVLTPAIPLFHAFGRVGCFLGGCCWGVPAPWGIAFTHALAAPNGVPLVPVQLFEAAFNLLLFLFLLWAGGRLAQKWLLLPIYLLLYAGFRFCIEFFRGDELRGVWLFSTSQWVSLAIITALMCLYIAPKNRVTRQQSRN